MAFKKTGKTPSKTGKPAKSDGKVPEKVKKSPRNTDKEAVSSGKIFGEWTFERLESEFGVKGRKAVFCARYATHEVGCRAAIEAGYAAGDASNTAYRMLKATEISRAVAALLKAKRDNIAEACGVTAEWLIENFKSVYTSCATIHTKEGQDGSSRDKMEYPDGALRALENLGKIAGVMVEKTKTEIRAELEHSGSLELRHVLEFGDPDDDFSDMPGGE